MWLPSRAFLLAAINAVKQHTVAGNFDGPLSIAYLGLFQTGTPVLTPDSVLADLVEADYAGYARQLLVWDAAYISQGGYETLEAASLHFTPTGSTVSDVITGAFIATALTAGGLLLSTAFGGSGYPMANTTNALSVIARYQYPFVAQYGDAIVVA